MSRHIVVADTTIAGVACAESGADTGCGKVRTGAAPCRESRTAGEGAHLRGSGSVFRPHGPGDTVTTKAERFFHDVSQYGGGPVTPSKISMMIICP